MSCLFGAWLQLQLFVFFIKIISITSKIYWNVCLDLKVLNFWSKSPRSKCNAQNNDYKIDYPYRKDHCSNEQQVCWKFHSPESGIQKNIWLRQLFSMNKMFVLSAKRIIKSSSIKEGRSFTKTRKIIGPNMYPCGTPRAQAFQTVWIQHKNCSFIRQKWARQV